MFIDAFSGNSLIVNPQKNPDMICLVGIHMAKLNFACTGETVFRHVALKATIHKRTKFFLYKKKPGFFFVSRCFLAELYAREKIIMIKEKSNLHLLYILP